MKLNTKRTILVGFAFFLICAFWQAYDTLVPKILTDKFGMPQSVSGIIMALDNMLALFLLPLFGSLSDRTKSRFGKRTPFITIGTIVAVIALVCLSFADNMQLRELAPIEKMDSAALEVLYDENPTITGLDGEKAPLAELISRESFVSMADPNTEGYTDFVVPARQAYAAAVRTENPIPLFCFVGILLIILVSMGTFRSPAVALMPDVTVKPLRSKANSIINLMGAVGGILILILGMVFGTGAPENALMSYQSFFMVVAAIMIVSLAVFLSTVREPKWSAEMLEDTARYGIEEIDEEKAASGDRALSKAELVSLLLILASVVLWFMGYNAVSSKYSVYAGKVLGLDYNMTLTIANAAAIVSYIPVGIIASKVGRKKCILAGILMLSVAFGAASFMRQGSSMLLANALFTLAGIGWATINVNSYPMVVELSKGSNIGKYTGFYYTASMAAQIVTPIFSGVFMDIEFTLLFPYATIFVAAAFFTMLFVKHGDSRPEAAAKA